MRETNIYTISSSEIPKVLKKMFNIKKLSEDKTTQTVFRELFEKQTKTSLPRDFNRSLSETKERLKKIDNNCTTMGIVIDKYLKDRVKLYVKEQYIKEKELLEWLVIKYVKKEIEDEYELSM